MQILGSIAFVSRLFLMCVKTVRTKYIILVRGFTLRCSQAASCIMLSRSNHPQLLENLPQRRCCSPRPLDSEWRISATLGWAASVPIPRGLGIKLSFHGMAPVVFTFWEAAPVDAVLVDRKDDGIGANKDVKDS